MFPPSTTPPAGRSQRAAERRDRRAVRRTRLRHLLRTPRQVRRKLSHDRVLGMSAEAGFWQLVSLPSLLLAVFGALGYFSGVLGHADIKRIHDDVLRAAGTS